MMFTGIVEEIGIVSKVTATGLQITATKVLDDLQIASSICVNGACLTVTGFFNSGFEVDVVHETRSRTNLPLLIAGDVVNLERGVSSSGRLDGHIVQGHVDTTGQIISIVKNDDSLLININVPHPFRKYIVEKGFIAVDGVSLTVVECDESFAVMLVPFTQNNTVLGIKQKGDKVNLEVDILAKYLERLISKS